MTILMLCRVIRIHFRGKAFKPILLLIFINPCIAGICDTTGVSMTTASEAAILLGLMPFVVVILTRVVQGVRMHMLSLIAMVMAVVGLLITKVFDETFSLGGSVLGYLFLFGYMLAWSVYTILSRGMSSDFSAVEMTYLMATAGTVWFNAIALIGDGGLRWIAVSFQEPQVALALLCQGVLTAALGFLLLNYAICRMPAAQNNMIYINVVTVTGVLTDIIVLHDSFGWYTFVGLFLLVTAVILFNVPLLRQQNPSEQ